MDSDIIYTFWACYHVSIELCITLYCWYLIQGETTPVYVAADLGNFDLLNMLIDAGCDVNIANVVSLYTIHVAAAAGYFID